MADLKTFYFSEFEDRKPEPPLPHSIIIETIWQCLAICTVGLGLWYLSWRWMFSFNPDVSWFSYLVFGAEVCAFIGLLLYVHNLWSVNDTPQTEAPEFCDELIPDRVSKTPIKVDVFLPTYNEDPEMTRYSIRDAKAITYPYELDLRIYVLDDGNRTQMKKVANEEDVNYITRSDNAGYKAGNLRNAMAVTQGDFIVILDSDTRVFPTFLEHTLGYFRDPDVAWVQTPQWFYDIPKGRGLIWEWTKRYGCLGGFTAKFVERLIGPIVVGRDPFINDAKLFYDVIQRRRNGLNTSFCCGAGSIHRREAVMEVALKNYARSIDENANQFVAYSRQESAAHNLRKAVHKELSISTRLTPYKFHVSEDIYTSILLHSDPVRKWKSVYHPQVESKMLSPLDIQSWAMQRFKYAGGSLDILINDFPLFKAGLNFRQSLMYAATFWSYLTPLWTVIFIAAPLIALFTGLSPIAAYSIDFFLHLLPFLIIHEMAAVFATWGVDNRQGKMLNIAFFSFNIMALWAVLRGKEIKFHVTPKQRDDQRHIGLVAPQIAVVAITIMALVYAFTQAWIAPEGRDIGLLVVNTFWALYNANAMTVLINAALWTPDKENGHNIDVKNRLVKQVHA
ncbi:glycosyltransferase [Amylibacter sp. SFDW26]|uniref:glycosyltransferase family 2 protein n=1 Tax=Amylibacter sp. SFDW26 TaxID=2652722 RepID=UPI001262467F|nr:cellulose synthase catalytic subunit [Amylibacter sp. SFDW26]KAB7614673.1 glycosyltransferase [Amylibacter sp. SFDW26]